MRTITRTVTLSTAVVGLLISTASAEWECLSRWTFAGTGPQKLKADAGAPYTMTAALVDLTEEGCVRFQGKYNAVLRLPQPARGLGECATSSWALYVRYDTNPKAAEQVIANVYRQPAAAPTYGKRLMIKCSPDAVEAAAYHADGSTVGSATLETKGAGPHGLTVMWKVDGRKGSFEIFDGNGLAGGEPVKRFPAATEDPSPEGVLVQFGSNCAGNQPFSGDIREIALYHDAAEAPDPGVTVASPGPPLSDEWTLRFQDDFARAELGRDWKVVDGTWGIRDGKLAGRGVILCTREFPGAHRIEYDAVTDETDPCDLSAILSANDKAVKGGAFFGFGSENNTCGKLLLLGREVNRVSAVCTPGKTYHIACQRDGDDFLHTVDDREIQRYTNREERFLRHGAEGGVIAREYLDLSGEDHNRVGLYLYAEGAIDNVKVYTKLDTAKPPPTPPETGQPEPNLVANPGFEQLRYATRDQPAHWLELRWTRQDSIEVVTDAGKAHWGRRYLSLFAPGEEPIEAHSLPPGGMRLTPGREYEIRVWARREEQPATLVVEPGHGREELTPAWTEYVFRHVHPADASELLGLSVGVRGGPAAIDDVSLVPAGASWAPPPEWQADRLDLMTAATEPRWPAGSDGERWKKRVPIVLSEVMGQDASGYPVALRLGDLLPSWGYDFLSLEGLRLVDAARPRESVPWTVVEADQAESFSGNDYLLFLASCPARTRKTYYAYFEDRAARPARTALSRSIPEAFAKPSPYPHRLYCDIGQPEPRASAACRLGADGPVLVVRDWAGRDAEAMILSPGGADRATVPMTPDAVDPCLRRSAPAFRLPGKLPEEGVWEFVVTLRDDTGATETLHVPFVHRAALWASSNVREIKTWDPPVYGADRTARLAAARNERESFQVAVESSGGLASVTITVSDLARVGGGGVIPADRVSVGRVEDIYITRPLQGSRAGWYPDVILPWRTHDVPAGTRRVAWITVSVPKDVPGGTYRGTVRAVAGDGARRELAVELAVLDFELPDRPIFTPILGADLWATRSWYDRAPELVNPSRGSYQPFDREAVITYAHLLARNYCTPFYYYPGTSPYPAPWHYDPDTKSVTFDFSEFDRQAEALLEAGAKYLFMGRLKSGWRAVTSFRDWKDDALEWSGAWKSRPWNHIYRSDSPEGLAMIRAWAEGLGKHLEAKGLLDNTYVYIVDEAKTHEVREAVAKVGQALRSVTPPLRTFAVSYARRWHPFFEHTSALASTADWIDDEVWQEFRRRGIEYWGTYNRMNMVSYPLSIPRIVGPHCWSLGVSHYFQWASWKLGHAWLNAHTYAWARANAGYPSGTFLTGAVGLFGRGHLAYAWPAGEPLPPGKTRAFATSLRLEAIRESVEDYEYLAMIEKLAVDSAGDTTARRNAENILQRFRQLLVDSVAAVYDVKPYLDSHAVFLLDEERYQALRREMGRAIEQSVAGSRSDLDTGGPID